MRYKTLHNMELATAMIAAKGYDWDTANEIAIVQFERVKQNGMPVEWWIDKIAPAEEVSA